MRIMTFGSLRKKSLGEAALAACGGWLSHDRTTHALSEVESQVFGKTTLFTSANNETLLTSY
jgi:hypothetical protein